MHDDTATTKTTTRTLSRLVEHQKHSSSSSGVASDGSDENEACTHYASHDITSPINTIKYNAKTNILHQQKLLHNAASNAKKIHFLDQTYKEGVKCRAEKKKLLNMREVGFANAAHTPNVTYCTLQKANTATSFFKTNNKPGNFKTISFGTNKKYATPSGGGSASCRVHSKMPKATLASLLENAAAISSVADTSCSQHSATTATTSADSLHTPVVNGIESMGTSLNVDTSTESQDRSFGQPMASFNSFKVAPPPPPPSQRHQDMSECFHWVNEETVATSASPSSLTPGETTSSSSASTSSSSYSNTEPVPNNNLSSSTSSLYSSKAGKVSPLPFPTNHFNFVNENRNSIDNKCSDCVTQPMAVSSDTVSSASSSSGCSSENPNAKNQYYLPNVCVDDYSEIQPNNNRDENFSMAMSYVKPQLLTYKPILKTSTSLKKNSTQTNGSNSTGNTVCNHSTFRSSKIDFV